MYKFLKYFILCCFITPCLFSSSIELNLENDCIIPYDDDSDYSHGTEIKYMSDESYYLFDNIGFSILQNMYTPDEIDSPDIQYGDRPYCGLLMASFIGQQQFEIPSGILSIEHQYGVGVIGENSFAEDTQKLVHDIRGCRDPMGWDNQISNELILQYQLHANLNMTYYEGDHFNVMIIPRTSFYLGNFRTQLEAGFDIKFGLYPSNNIGNDVMFSANKKRNFNIYFLVGVEGKLVFYDASLDGNLFNDCIYHVESESTVGQLHYGIHLNIYDLEFEYLIIHRTREYETQDEPPDYGRISVKYNF